MALIRRASYPADITVYKDGSTFYAHYRSDGTLNSSSTAQTLLQETLDDAEGLHVLINNATYPLTTSLEVYDNTYIECESWNTLFQGAGGHKLITNEDWTGGNENIQIRGGTWDGNNGTSSDGGIIFDNVDNILISDCQSINSSAENIKVRNSAYTRIIGNYCKKAALVSGNSGRANINSATGSGYTLIANNTCIDAYGEAIGVFRATGKHISITGNTCLVTTAADSPVRRGHLLVEGTGAREADGVAITGNTVVSNYYGLNIISSNGIAAAANTFQSFATTSLEGIHVSGVSDYITLTGNIIRDYGKSGIFIEDQSRRCTVTGNLIINPGTSSAGTYYGMLFQPRGGAIRDMTVTGNVIADDQDVNTMQHGMYFDLDTRQMISCIFANNSIRGGLSTGIGFSLGTGGHLDSCYFRSNLGYYPIGNIGTPWNHTHDEVGLKARGSDDTYSATPEASTDYTVVNTDILLTSTGGTDVSITITGPSSNVIDSGLTTLRAYYVPRLYKVNFGAFSVAPTTKIHAIG